MAECSNPYHGHRVPREVIAHAVRFSLRFALSVRDVEELRAERGVAVAYETVRRWGATFGAPYAEELRRRRPHTSRSRTWHRDEMAVPTGCGAPSTSTGDPRRVPAGSGRFRQVPAGSGRFRQAPRDTAAAARCVRRLVDVTAGTTPARITTDT